MQRGAQQVAVPCRQRDVQVAVAGDTPAVAQTVGRQLQAARLPFAVVVRRRRAQHRRPLCQQFAGGGVGQGAVGRQRQRRQAQQLPGVADRAGRGVKTVTLPAALVVQRSGRQAAESVAQPLPGCLIARRAGYRQRQRVHPQQSAVVVQTVRRDAQRLPLQPAVVGQGTGQRHRQRRQPGDIPGVGQRPAADIDRVALPAPAGVDDVRATQRQRRVAVQAARAGVIAGQRQRAPRRQLPGVGQVRSVDRQVAHHRQRAPVIQPAQRQRGVAVRRQRAAVGQYARRGQRHRQRAVALYPPAVAQAVRRQQQIAGLPLAVILCRRRAQHRPPLRQQCSGAAVAQAAVYRQRQRRLPQQLTGVADAVRRGGQAVALPLPLVVQHAGRQAAESVAQPPARRLVARRAGYRQRQRVHSQQGAAVVQRVRRQRHPVARQRAGVRQLPAPDIPCPRRPQRAAVVQLIQRQPPVAAQRYRPLMAPPPGSQLQTLRRQRARRLHPAGRHRHRAAAGQHPVRRLAEVAARRQTHRLPPLQRAAVGNPVRRQRQRAARHHPPVGHPPGPDRQLTTGQQRPAVVQPRRRLHRQCLVRRQRAAVAQLLRLRRHLPPAHRAPVVQRVRRQPDRPAPPASGSPSA
ncbi:hypothetical protein CS559_04281 [Dickeya solani]|nr:hypothetical protein CS559_04281 [Dickeya solani]